MLGAGRWIFAAVAAASSWTIALSVAVAAAVRSGCMSVVQQPHDVLRQRATCATRPSRKIQTLPLRLSGQRTPPATWSAAMVADVDTFADGLLMGFTQLFTGVLTILGTLLFMLYAERAHHAGGGLSSPR